MSFSEERKSTHLFVEQLNTIRRWPATKPRRMTSREKGLLEGMAKNVMEEIQRRERLGSSSLLASLKR